MKRPRRLDSFLLHLHAAYLSEPQGHEPEVVLASAGLSCQPGGILPLIHTMLLSEQAVMLLTRRPCFINSLLRLLRKGRRV
jgi:hypothetical protein